MTVPTRALRKHWLGCLALSPYITLKTFWAMGSRLGYDGSGSPGFDGDAAPRWAQDMHDIGLDATALLALCGIIVLVALPKIRVSRPICHVAAAAGVLVGLGGMAGLALVGLEVVGIVTLEYAGYSRWVPLLAYASFAAYGAALYAAARPFSVGPGS